MQKKRLISAAAIFLALGIFLIVDTSSAMTGSIISVKYALSTPVRMQVGLLFILSSVVILLFTFDLDEVVSSLFRQIDETKASHRGRKNYLDGLDKIKESIKFLEREYSRAHGKNLKKNIASALRKWSTAIKRREEHFDELPRHAGARDMPDWGFYPYHPIEGKKSKYAKLRITHYTNRDGYDKIRKDIKEGKALILKTDPTGWTFFTEEPIPKNIKIRSLRYLLGTGVQEHVGKKKRRNPEYMVTLTIKVPKERILIKESYYGDPREGLRGNKKLHIRKYAVAGGIRLQDLVEGSVVAGERYKTPKITEDALKKEEWKVKIEKYHS